MGRPRKPTALKILDGDRKDRINGAEPSAPPGIGEPPGWLDRFGKEAWGRLAEVHRASLVMTAFDSDAAALYCQTYSIYRHALATITRDLAGRPVADDECPGPHEPEGPHPLMKTVWEAQRQMARLLGKFGMTPSDRAGLHVQAAPEEDEFVHFLNRKKTGTDGGKAKG